MYLIVLGHRRYAAPPPPLVRRTGAGFVTWYRYRPLAYIVEFLDRCCINLISARFRPLTRAQRAKQASTCDLSFMAQAVFRRSHFLKHVSPRAGLSDYDNLTRQSLSLLGKLLDGARDIPVGLSYVKPEQLYTAPTWYRIETT